MTGDGLHILAALREQTEDDSLAEYGTRAPAAALAAATPTVDLPLRWNDLGGSLLRRRSVRFFDDRPVPFELVADSVHAARAADATLWPDERGPELDFYVAARAVDDLAPGVYRFDRHGHTHLQVLPAAGLQDLVLQPEFGLAPVIVLAIGSLEAALGEHGSHGHRLLLERGGAACELAWLTAVDRGYSGSIFAGFLPAGLRTLVGIDGYRRTQLLALALGRAAHLPQPRTGSH